MENKILVKILFFAKSRELSGLKETTLTISTPIVYADLFDLICDTFNLNKIKNCLILAVNGEYCENSTDFVLELKVGDEIAIIPPLSGG